jgi:hypothetical protein
MRIGQERFLITVHALSKLVGKSFVTRHPLDNHNPKGIPSYFNLLAQRAKIEGFIV